jgi:hypothetical protein
MIKVKGIKKRRNKTEYDTSNSTFSRSVFNNGRFEISTCSISTPSTTVLLSSIATLKNQC